MTLARPRLGKPAASPEEIFEALFRPMGVDGVYGRAGAYEAIVEALGAFIGKERDARAEVVRFPPVVSRALIEKSGYLKSFPQSPGLRLRARRRREADRRGGDAIRSGRDLDRRAGDERSRARAGGLLSRLSHGRRARADPSRRLALRRRLRLLSPRALARHRPPAILPHARIRRHRRARPGDGLPSRAGRSAPPASPTRWG